MQEDLDFSTTDIDIDDILPVKKVVKKEEKKKRQYVDPVELHNELMKHIFNKKINEDYVMDKKLAVLCMKITDELFEKGNFRGYHNGWKYEMKSKAYENLVKYVHQYDATFVDRDDFFVNWTYRVHELKLIAFFDEIGFNFEDFRKTLIDVKKKFVKKAKDPNKEVKDSYKKVTASDLLAFFESKGNTNYTVSDFKNDMYSRYPDMEQQFEDHKKRNSFNYVTQMIYRSAQHVIKNEKRNKQDNQRLDDAILYRTDDFDDEAIEKDNRFITFDDNKLDYGGFGY